GMRRSLGHIHARGQRADPHPCWETGLHRGDLDAEAAASRASLRAPAARDGTALARGRSRLSDALALAALLRSARRVLRPLEPTLLLLRRADADGIRVRRAATAASPPWP